MSEEEKGAAFSVFKDGELVVDLWGGYADIEAWQPWKQSTVANTFSLFNVAVSLCLGLLYERLVNYVCPSGLHYIFTKWYVAMLDDDGKGWLLVCNSEFLCMPYWSGYQANF